MLRLAVRGVRGLYVSRKSDPTWREIYCASFLTLVQTIS